MNAHRSPTPAVVALLLLVACGTFAESVLEGEDPLGAVDDDDVAPDDDDSAPDDDDVAPDDDDSAPDDDDVAPDDDDVAPDDDDSAPDDDDSAPDDDDVAPDDDDAIPDDDDVAPDDDDVIPDDDDIAPDDDDVAPDDDDVAPDDDDAGGPVLYLEEVFSSAASTLGLGYGQATWFGDAAASPLTLDLYQPAGDTSTERPAIVWLHGGGFMSGTSANPNIVTLATAFARRGWVCVSINYRLRSAAEVAADELGTITDAVHDARAAVRWLRANETLYGIDTTRIAIGGASAGAITSLGVAYAQSLGEGTSGSPGYSSGVSAVVDFWGSLPGTWDTVMGAGEPPLIIIHGTADATVPYVEAEELADRAALVGVPYELHPLAGQGHAAWSNWADFEDWIPPFLYTHVIQ